MINIKAIKADEELLLYRSSKRKVEGKQTSQGQKVAKLMRSQANGVGRRRRRAPKFWLAMQLTFTEKQAEGMFGGLHFVVVI